MPRCWPTTHILPWPPKPKSSKLVKTRHRVDAWRKFGQNLTSCDDLGRVVMTCDFPTSHNLQYVYAMLDRRLPSADNGHQNRAANPPPKAWGIGRVAFIARIDTIRAELAQGWPLTVVYARHWEALGIGYWGFWRLVARYAADARPSPTSRLCGRSRTASRAKKK